MSKSTVEPELLHAWFSPLHALASGSAFYRRPDGSVVEVTEVSEKPTCVCGWGDETYLGQVVHYRSGGFIRTARVASYSDLWLAYEIKRSRQTQGDPRALHAN